MVRICGVGTTCGTSAEIRTEYEYWGDTLLPSVERRISRTFGYDIEKRLTSASPGVTLTYDPLGRLHQVASGSGTTNFLYDGDALVAEYVSGALLRRHVHWPGADVPMVSYAGDTLNSPTQLYADHQGSIIAHADAAGNRIAINRYEEYGIPAAANTGRFQYTGQIWIPELGMYHYKSRVYSPYLGRFLQVDPIGYEGGINFYVYVQNDPINLTDPDGQQPTPSSVLQSAGDAYQAVDDYLVGIGSDLGTLGVGIAQGRFEWAFGGMPPTLGGGAGGLSRLGRVAASTEASAAGQAANRAREVHSVLDPIAQTRRTTAVLETSRGRILAGGGRDLIPGQRAALRQGETAARAPGVHAEVTALRQAAASGATPRSLRTTTPICENCAGAIRASGGQVTSQTTAVWRKPWWRFWER